MISYCIITDGREPDKLDALIESIHLIFLSKGSEYEIIVAGNPHIGIDADLIIPMPNTAKQGRLGALRNGAVSCASGEIIIVVDDDMTFDAGFISGVEMYIGEWDLMACKILNPDGSRYWDWKAHENGMNWLLDYNEISDKQSLTGGLTIMKAHVWEHVKWNDELGFNQAEDVDFTNRCKAAGYKIVFNQSATVIHNAPYTQIGVGVFKKG